VQITPVCSATVIIGYAGKRFLVDPMLSRHELHTFLEARVLANRVRIPADSETLTF
jgi:L-ascorbate metabolism protein UlaG (beta-lactamase superfamily)